MSKITKTELFNLLKARHKGERYTKLAEFPNPDCFKDMSKATNRIKQAINNAEKITIVGDYDVDGVVSTTIIVDFLEKLGLK